MPCIPILYAPARSMRAYFDGELRTGVHPRRTHGRMWLPACFASWTGASMVVDTSDDQAWRGHPSPTPAIPPVLHRPVLKKPASRLRVTTSALSPGVPVACERLPHACPSPEWLALS